MALRDAFDFLGFRADLIGGSGDFDVLLSANIGEASFKVSVDGKTSKDGKVIDRQIDWISLDYHKKKNKADYSLVVGPDYAGGNLPILCAGPEGFNNENEAAGQAGPCE